MADDTNQSLAPLAIGATALDIAGSAIRAILGVGGLQGTPPATQNQAGPQSQGNSGSLNSTCVSAYSYDAQNQDLTLVYRGSGKSYVYHGVPRDEVTAMLSASSIGRYVNSTIKKYPFN